MTNNLFIPYDTLGPVDPNSLTFIAVIQSENPINPYIQMWSLGAQRELSRNTTLEINYIGTKGTHFLNRRQIAQPYGIPDADLPFCQKDPSDVTHHCPNKHPVAVPALHPVLYQQRLAWLLQLQRHERKG